MATNSRNSNSTASGNIPIEFTSLEANIAGASLLVIMLLTLFGNSTICAVIFRHKRMWTEMNLFLLNLALADIASCMSMGFSLVTAFKREWCYGEDSVCAFNAVLTTTLLCNAIFTHTMISIDRYLALVKPLKKIMTKKKAGLMIGSGWVLALAIGLAPLFGWGTISYNGSTMQCGPSFPKTAVEKLYILILALVGFIFPLAVMSCVYTRIYVVVRQHTRRISVSAVGRVAENALAMKRKVALTFFLALDAFVLCWTPFFAFVVVAVVRPSREHIPHGLGIAAFWCGYFNGACNPFIIGLRSEHFQKAFHKLLCWPFDPCRRQLRSKSVSSPDLANSTRVIQTTGLPQNSGATNGFANGGLNLADEVDSSKIKTEVNKIRTPSEKQRKVGFQEQPQSNNDCVFANFIHLIDGKIWNEAAV